MKKLFTSLFIILAAFSSVLAQRTDTIIGRSYKGPDSNNVYTFVDQNPEYPGGDGELINFLRRNVRYPKYELKHNVEGNVLLRFILEADGSVSNIKLIRGVSTGLDNEAIRVVKLLPNFIPGRQMGEPVRVYFNLPIIFKLR